MKERDIDKVTVYDRRPEYKEFIAPKVTDLQLYCQIYKIPMFFAAAVKNDENGTDFKKAMVYGSTEVRLKDKNLGNAVYAAASFKTAPPLNVRRAVREILEYLEALRAENGTNTQEVFLGEVELTDDLITRLKTVIDGWGDKLVIPGKSAESIMDEDDGILDMY